MSTATMQQTQTSATDKSFFILELPTYRAPRWKNIFTTMVQKAQIFVVDAGKVIMVISLLLWVMSSYGPGERMANVETEYAAKKAARPDLLRE